MNHNRQTLRRRVRLQCRACQAKVFLDETNMVYIISYTREPWFNGFVWYCYGCRSARHEFFDSGEVQFEDVRLLGTHERDEYGDAEVARLYAHACIQITANTDALEVERQLAIFIAELNAMDALTPLFD